MNDRERRFGERLARDIERVLGVGVAIDDIEIAGDEGTGAARVTATLLIGDRVETIEAVGDNILAVYRPILQRAAEIRLSTAFWQMIGPS